MSELGRDVEEILWRQRREALLRDVTAAVEQVVLRHLETLQLLHEEQTPATTPQELFERELGEAWDDV